MDESVYINDISKCVRCGKCKASCPTYEHDVTEGLSARGRLALLHNLSTGHLKPSRLLNDRIYSCILCGLCDGTCPLGVNITEVIYHGRALLSKTDMRRRHLRLITKFLINRLDLGFNILRLLQHTVLPFMERRDILPFNIKVPDSPLKDENQVYKPSIKKGRVALFTGCSINYLFPSLGESLIRVLLSLGYEVVLPKGEVCCGVPLRGLGLENEAAGLAEKNMEIFGKLKVDAVLSLCPTCTLAIKKQYPMLIGSGIEKAMDINEFLFDKVIMHEVQYNLPRIKAVSYHDPCHLSHGLGIKKEPREILKNIGLEIIKPAGEGCCGFGGALYQTGNKNTKNRFKVVENNYSENDIETIVTSCPGCMMQLNRRRPQFKDIRVMHMIELIEEAYC